MPNDALPPLAAKWTNSLLSAPVPAEATATCADCVMCAKDGKSPVLGCAPFRPEVKCCTYLPELHNFLVGALLSDDDPAIVAGRPGVESRIDAGAGVTPYGLMQPPGYRQTHDQERLGRDLSLLCPHYQSEGGTCGIWKYREPVCATFFCKHDRGQAGTIAWNAIKQFLQRLHSKLALWCADQLDVGLLGLTAMVVSSDATDSPEVAAARWGPWLGREREFYRACYERVVALSAEEAIAVGGLEVEVLGRAVRANFDQLASDMIPDRLRVSAHQTIAVSAEGSTVVTHSAYDPITLPAALLSVMHYFDGRPTHEVLAQLVDERGVALDKTFLRQLIDYGVLVGVR